MFNSLIGFLHGFFFSSPKTEIKTSKVPPQTAPTKANKTSLKTKAIKFLKGFLIFYVGLTVFLLMTVDRSHVTTDHRVSSSQKAPESFILDTWYVTSFEDKEVFKIGGYRLALNEAQQVEFMQRMRSSNADIVDCIAEISEGDRVTRQKYGVVQLLNKTDQWSTGCKSLFTWAFEQNYK